MFFWPRLWVAIDKDLREELDSVQAVVDSAIYCCFVFILSAAMCLLYWAILPWKAWWHWPASAATCLLLARLCYFLALPRYAQYGELFAATFDQYRDKLKPTNLLTDLDAYAQTGSPVRTEREANRSGWRFLRWHRYRNPARPTTRLSRAGERPQGRRFGFPARSIATDTAILPHFNWGCCFSRRCLHFARERCDVEQWPANDKVGSHHRRGASMGLLAHEQVIDLLRPLVLQQIFDQLHVFSKFAPDRLPLLREADVNLKLQLLESAAGADLHILGEGGRAARSGGCPRGRGRRRPRYAAARHKSNLRQRPGGAARVDIAAPRRRRNARDRARARARRNLILHSTDLRPRTVGPRKALTIRRQSVERSDPDNRFRLQFRPARATIALKSASKSRVASM